MFNCLLLDEAKVGCWGECEVKLQEGDVLMRGSRILKGKKKKEDEAVD